MQNEISKWDGMWCVRLTWIYSSGSGMGTRYWVRFHAASLGTKAQKEVMANLYEL